MKVCKFDIGTFDNSIFDYLFSIASLGININQTLLMIKDYDTQVGIINENSDLDIVG